MVDGVENSSLAFFVWRIISTSVNNKYHENIMKQSEISGKNSKSRFQVKTVRADFRKRQKEQMLGKNRTVQGFWRRECR